MASPPYRYTPYFERKVLMRRPYLRKSWCQAILANPIRVEIQEGDRYRFWGPVEELGGRYLRVITLAEKVTIHNAFRDRNFRP